jgi:AcrR family transcriptional regulator
MKAMGEGGSDPAAITGSGEWWRDRRVRQGRRRPRADGLTIERITKAALAVVDDDGLEALTVRRLADDLGTGSASLYRHIASREELLVLLADQVIGEVRFPPDEMTGREKVEWVARELRRVLVDHHNLLPALTASPLLGPNALRGSERGLAYLLEAGFEPAAAVPAFLVLIDYVLGTVYFDTSRAGGGSRGREQGPAELFEALPADGFPTLWANEGAIERSLADDVFEFGLGTFLDGLERRFPPANATD